MTRPATWGWCKLSAVSMSPNVHFNAEEIATFCRRNHIRKLAFFGSVLRADFCDDSDIDVLVEFEPGHVPGFAFIGLQDELGHLLGRRVDLHTPAFLSEYFRDQVLREAEPAYVAA
jgi:predicted nucleotidyltransferase